MKRHSFLKNMGVALTSLLALLLPTACNLFIDEQPDEDGFKNVPEHTGDGYDAPVTVNDQGLEITYQYKRDVRVLQAEEADQWVTRVRYDSLQAFIEVHFRKDTPADLLPVAGEVLMCTVTDQFLFGACHRLQYSFEDEGVIKYVGTFVPMEEAFEELDINGQMDYSKVEGLNVQPEPLEDTSAARRKLDAETGIGFENYKLVDLKPIRKEDNSEYGFETSFYVHFEYTKGLLPDGNNKGKAPSTDSQEADASRNNVEGEANVKIAIDLPSENQQNYLLYAAGFNFDKFSLRNKRLTFDINETIVTNNTVELSGGLEAKLTLLKASPVNIPIPVGPVVLVFFLDLQLEATLDIHGAITLTRHTEKSTTYTLDLLAEKKLTKQVHKNIDTGWQMGDVEFKAELKLEFSITVGLGIFGKVISIKVIPTVEAKFEAEFPESNKDSRGYEVYDISKSPGIYFGVELKVKLGVFLDLSLAEIIGGTQQFNVDEQRAKLEDYANDVEKKYIDEMKEKMKDDDKAKEEAEQQKTLFDKLTGDPSAYIVLGPWELKKRTKLFGWFPTLNDKKTVIKSIWNEKGGDYGAGGMEFWMEISLSEIGFLPSLPGQKYQPSICLKDASGEIVDYIYPADGTYTSDLKKNHTYRFRLPDMTDDKKYYAYPCFFKLSTIAPKAPKCIDKGIPFTATAPTVWWGATPYEVEGVWKKTSDAPDKQKYIYTCIVDAYAYVRGNHYIAEWGFHDVDENHSDRDGQSDSNLNKDKSYRKHNSKDKQEGDGAYKFVITMVKSTNKENYTFSLAFRPYFIPWVISTTTETNSKTGETSTKETKTMSAIIYEEELYRITVGSDGQTTITDIFGNELSRRRTPGTTFTPAPVFGQHDQPDEVHVEAIYLGDGSKMPQTVEL